MDAVAIAIKQEKKNESTLERKKNLCAYLQMTRAYTYEILGNLPKNYQNKYKAFSKVPGYKVLRQK